MKKYNLGFITLIITLFYIPLAAYNVKPPRLTVILVVDQFAHHYIDKLYPHLKQGIGYLLSHGVNYTNAYWPHAQPGTATGHAGLNTGTHAEYHGFVSNNWYE